MGKVFIKGIGWTPAIYDGELGWVPIVLVTDSKELRKKKEKFVKAVIQAQIK